MNDLVKRMRKAGKDSMNHDCIYTPELIEGADALEQLQNEPTYRIRQEQAERIEQLEVAQARREPLADGREHLTVTNEFQSDKYPWCPAGFVPLKITDPMAVDLLQQYAEKRRSVDAEFTRDLREALLYPGNTKS